MSFHAAARSAKADFAPLLPPGTGPGPAPRVPPSQPPLQSAGPFPMAGDREITAPLDVASLRAGWTAKGEERPRLHARLSLGARTDMGRVRENNEDKFDFLEPDEPAVLARKGRFYAIADGMGGHQAG